MPQKLAGVTAIWWEVRGYGRYGGMLQPLQVVRETPKTLRMASLDHRGKVCEFTLHKTSNMLPTWKQAFEQAKLITREKIEISQRNLAFAKETLGDLENLREPTP